MTYRTVVQLNNCVAKTIKKHLKNVGPIRRCEPLYALILHCHSPGVTTVARRLRIDVHDNDNNDNAWQRGPLWSHRIGPTSLHSVTWSPSCSWNLSACLAMPSQRLRVHGPARLYESQPSLSDECPLTGSTGSLALAGCGQAMRCMAITSDRTDILSLI